jgi:hypothetical protein
MTAEIVARAILMVGAFLLVLGPGLQARLEMREYHELLEALQRRSDLPDTTREYLGLLEVGPSMALNSPLGALRFALSEPSEWYVKYRNARAAFGDSGAAGDERVMEIRTHLARARNWAIVVLGSVLIFAGASIELAQTIATGQSG